MYYLFVFIVVVVEIESIKAKGTCVMFACCVVLVFGLLLQTWFSEKGLVEKAALFMCFSLSAHILF